MKIFRQQAFSLIELMVTVAIAGIVLMIAIPNMSNFIKNEQLTSTTNNLISSLMLARSKAVEQNQPVIMCASSDQSTCNSTDYKDGWIVGVDDDGNHTLDGTTDTLIKAQQATTADITINNTGMNIIEFDPRGFKYQPSGTELLSICDSRNDTHAKAVSVSKTGRITRGGSPSC